MAKKITLNGFIAGTSDKFEGHVHKDLDVEDSFEVVEKGKKITRKIIKKEEIDGLTIVYSVEV